MKLADSMMTEMAAMMLQRLFLIDIVSNVCLDVSVSCLINATI